MCIFAAALAFAGRASGASNTESASARAAADLEATMKRAATIEQEILKSRQALTARVESLEVAKRNLEAGITGLERDIAKAEAESAEMREESAGRALSLKNISGSVSAACQDLEKIMKQSPLTAFDPQRLQRVERFVEPVQLLGPADLFALAELFTDEIEFSAEIGVREAAYIDRNGDTRTGTILTLGKLTAIYNEAEETGFLSYKPDTRRLTAMSVAPSRRAQQRIQDYLAGREESAPIDLSGGSILQQADTEPSSTERVRHGGPVLVAFLLAGIGFFLHRRRARTPEAVADAAQTSWYRAGWGLWAIKPERTARRAAIAFIYVLGLGVYLWGTKSVSQGAFPRVELNIVSLSSLPPPAITGGRRVERTDQLREIEVSKTVTETPAEETDFEPDLVSPSFSGPLSSGVDFDIAQDLSSLTSQDVVGEAGLTFEAYELDQPPQAVFQVPPPYPFEAREQGVEGAVQVRMLVESDGSVAKVLIIDSRPKGLFEDSVMKSLPQWRFSPGKIEGKTVTAWVVTTIHFDLN
jgi:TonB family protein